MAKTFSPPSAVVIAGEVGGAALVLLAGWLLKKRNTKPQPPLSQLS